MLHQALTKNAPDQYYFQIAPNFLTVRTGRVIRALKAKEKTFKFKIFKEKQMVDETRKPFPGIPINGVIPIQKVQLNFFIPSHNPNQSAQYKIALYQLEEGSQVQNQVGSCQYINEYREHRTRRITESIDIGSDFTVNFDIFLNTTRNALEKYIKETREQNKEDARNDMLNNSGDYKNNVPRLSQARSQKNSKSSKGGEIISGERRFVSPGGRKIQRKNANQKKLLVRSGSPPRSQRSGGSPGSRKSRDLKFLAGRDGVSPKRERQSLAQQEVDKIEKQKQKIEPKVEPKVQPKAEPVVEEVKKQPELQEKIEEPAHAQEKEQEKEANFEEKQLEEQLLKQEEQRNKQDEVKQEERRKELEQLREESQKEEQSKKVADNTENPKQTQKQSAHNSAHSKPKSIGQPSKQINQQEDILADSSKEGQKKHQKVEWQKPIQIKRTNSFVSGQTSGFQKQSFSQGKDRMDSGTLIKYIIFMIVSFLLILQAMTPSSKV